MYFISQQYTIKMRLCSGVFIVTILSSIVILVFVCSMRARDKGATFRKVETLATELTNLQLLVKNNDRKLAIAQSQLKDAEKLFEDCQKNSKQGLRDIEIARESSKHYQQRAEELEQKIQKHDSKIEAVQLSIKSMKSEITPCKPTWSTGVDTNSVGGILHEFSHTLADCLGYCISLPACLAVDFNKEDLPTKRCWYHTSPIGPKETFSQVGTSQYKLNRICNKDQDRLNGHQNQRNLQDGQPNLEDMNPPGQHSPNVQSKQVLHNIQPVGLQNSNQNGVNIAQRQHPQSELEKFGQAGSTGVPKGWYAPMVHQNVRVEQGSGNANQNRLEVAQRQNLLGIGDEGGTMFGQQAGGPGFQKRWFAPVVHQNKQVGQGFGQLNRQNIPRVN